MDTAWFHRRAQDGLPQLKFTLIRISQISGSQAHTSEYTPGQSLSESLHLPPTEWAPSCAELSNYCVIIQLDPTMKTNGQLYLFTTKSDETGIVCRRDHRHFIRSNFDVSNSIFWCLSCQCNTANIHRQTSINLLHFPHITPPPHYTWQHNEAAVAAAYRSVTAQAGITLNSQRQSTGFHIHNNELSINQSINPHLQSMGSSPGSSGTVQI